MMPVRIGVAGFEIVERRGNIDFGAANAPIRLTAQAREARPITLPKL
jgi:4-hydroxyphenylpyruvate dioxygenase